MKTTQPAKMQQQFSAAYLNPDMTEHKATQSSAAKPRFFYGYAIVIAAFLIMVVILGMRYSFGVFIKPMIADFGWTRAAISAALSLSLIMECVMAIVLGGLNDKVGPRLIMTICGILCGIGYLLMAHISDIMQLYLLYLIPIGIGTTIWTPLASTVARWFVQKKTIMIGIVLSGISIGALVGPLVMELLISTYDWRTTCTIAGIAVLLVVILAAQFLKSEPAQIGQVALGDNQTTAERLQSRTESFSAREAIRTRQFWILFVMLTCFGYTLFAIQVHIVPYATDLGITPAIAAGVLAVLGGGSVVGRILLGSIGDTMGNKRASIICFGLIFLSSLWLIFTRELWGLYLFAVIFGFAYGGFTSQQTPLAVKLFGLPSLGLIFGFVCIGFSIGSALGPMLSGYVFDITGSYQIAFLACIVIAFIGFGLSIFLTPTRIKSNGKF